jgi:hypothetical protein
MTTYPMTDASGRSLADHAVRLGRTLDGLADRVRDAVAIAVGSAVDGAVQAAVRAALADLLGGEPMDRAPPTSSYYDSPSSYWHEPDDGWGRYDKVYDPPPAEPAACDVSDRPTRRWAALMLLGGRVLTNWFRRRPLRPGWRTLVCAGLVMSLALTATLPSGGLARSAISLTALAAGLRAGGDLAGSLLT